MAITTQDQILAGSRPPEFFHVSIVSPANAQGSYFSQLSTRLSVFVNHSIPGYPSSTLPSTLAGAAVVGPYQGAIPFNNPPTGQSAYLARFTAGLITTAANNYGKVLLADRVWHSGPIDVTSTSSQSVDSAAFAPRDNNGTADGSGFYLGIEVREATGAGTPDFTVSYTNSAGASGRIAQNTVATVASAGASRFWNLRLQEGDVGVRSIQSVTLTSSWTSGTVILCAYRIIAEVDVSASNLGGEIDGISAGLPEIYNNSVLHLLVTATGSTTAPLLIGSVTVTQG